MKDDSEIPLHQLNHSLFCRCFKYCAPELPRYFMGRLGLLRGSGIPHKAENCIRLASNLSQILETRGWIYPGYLQ